MDMVYPYYIIKVVTKDGMEAGSFIYIISIL